MLGPGDPRLPRPGAARKVCGQVHGGRAPDLRLPHLWAQRPVRTGEDLGRGAAVGRAWVEECLLVARVTQPLGFFQPGQRRRNKPAATWLPASLTVTHTGALHVGARGTDRSSPLTVVCP